MLRKVNIRISVALLTIALFVLAPVSAQDNVHKKMHKTFDVSGSTKLNVANKYGNIEVNNWSENSIDVLVEVKYTGFSEEKANELLEMISIKHHTEGSSIFFETQLDDDFGSKLNRMSSGKKSFEINYTIKMPHNVPVNFSNKYGNIFIDRLSSSSKIAVKYGNLKANDISSANKSPMTEVILGYSDANVEVCSWLKLTMKYSKIKIAESKALVILSKYSKVFVDRGSSIVSESKYDTYEIGTIANFVTEAGYSDFKFNSIGKKLHAETKYSDMKVGYIPASFEEVKIINAYGTYNLGIEEGASYKLKGIAKYGGISYPDNSRVNRFQETTSLEIEGLVGSNEKTATKVILETKYGSIKLNN